jgi:putative membrane protein
MKINNGLLAGLAACALLGLPAMAQYPGQTGSSQSTPRQTSPGTNQTQTRSRQSGSTSTTTTQEERGSATSKSKGSANRMTADSNFLMKAAEGNMAEVQLGELAKDKASNSSVKDFAQRMIDDHGRTLTEIQKMASDKAVTLPDKLTGKFAATKERLSKLSGAQFDRAYMTDMVNDHREDVKEFEQHAKTGTDPDIKAFAAKTLPVLQEHLRMAESIHSELSGGARKGESSREKNTNTDTNTNSTTGAPGKR